MNYRVYAGERIVPVGETTVRPVPYNETEQAEFVILRVSGETVLTVHSETAVRKAVVRPLSLGLQAEIRDEHTMTLRLRGACNFSLEINGTAHSNLCVFASPVRSYGFDANDARVYYYPAGVHDIDKLVIGGDDVIVYIDEGARLLGKLEFNGCKNLLVCGAGCVDDGKYSDVRHRVAVDLVGVRGARIEDICVLDSLFWCIRVFGCENVVIDNVKIIGHRGNTDGIDVCGSRRVLVENVFTRVWDDSLVVKGVDETDKRSVHYNYPGTDSDFSAGFEGLGDVHDVTFRHCTLWNDFARPIEIGVSLRADEVSRLRYEDIDIIHSTTGYPLMGAHHGDRADVHDVIFENIRIEDAPGAQLFDFRMTNSVWSTDTRKGRIHDILFRNIALVGKPGLEIPPEPSRLEGLDAAHGIENVRFENVTMLGRAARTAEECQLDVRDYVKNVTFSADETLRPIRHIASTLELSPFECDERGRWHGEARVTLKNESDQRVSGDVWLNVAPANMADTRKRLDWILEPGETYEKVYPLTLQAGHYLISVGSSGVEVDGAWRFVELDGDARGFECDFVNYYGECPGTMRLSVRDSALVLAGDVTRESRYSFTLYAARAAAVRQGEVLFTAEETDFGECNAVVWGAHGEELAPQLRCPGEITYVFKNQPAVDEIRAMTFEGGQEEIRVPLGELPAGEGALLIEIAIHGAAHGKRRYPFTLFHSVIPAESAHMFVKIPDA